MLGNTDYREIQTRLKAQLSSREGTSGAWGQTQSLEWEEKRRGRNGATMRTETIPRCYCCVFRGGGRERERERIKSRKKEKTWQSRELQVGMQNSTITLEK